MAESLVFFKEILNQRTPFKIFTLHVSIIRGGGGGYSPISAIYVCAAPKGMVFEPFGLKTGIDFDHYFLKSGMVFKGTTIAYKRITLFNSK